MMVRHPIQTGFIRFFFPCAFFCYFFFGMLPPVSGDTMVRVGVYENPPKIFTSDSGRVSGIFIDILEHIAENEGWKLQYIPGTWKEGLMRLERGEIELMPDVAYTTGREALFAFHKIPVLSSWFQVYAPKGSGIHSILDLKEKKIAVLERSVQQEAFGQLADDFDLDITLVAVSDYRTIFDQVARHEVDAAVTNRFHGLVHAKRFGLEDTAVIFHPTNLFFAAPKNASQRLLESIDRHLSDLKKEPQSVYYVSLKRWVSEEVRFSLPEWVKFSGLAMLLILVLSLAGSFILKHQVNERTRELKRINREMEQRIVARTAELAAATEKAQAADRIKSAFLATMSHELRTPLNSIIGFTGILLQELAGPLNPEQYKQMTMVQNSSRHLLALINDVLDISKIEAGQLELSPAPFDLKASIEKAIALILPLVEKKGIALTVDVADGIGTAHTDQRRFEQILLNLLSNACKFTEKGEIRVACGIENGQVLLSVSDTGIGMRPEEISSIFQPFHQIDSGLSRKHEGTGLGLSICKKLLERMGGTIDVKSRWAEGSTFTVRLPKVMEGRS